MDVGGWSVGLFVSRTTCIVCYLSISVHHCSCILFSYISETTNEFLPRHNKESLIWIELNWIQKPKPYVPDWLYDTRFFVHAGVSIQWIGCWVFFPFPTYISGVHHFWVRFLRMWPFFNPTIKVVTFRLRGWCMLGVFLLPAFTRLGYERQDLLSPCDEMHVCTD